MTDIVVIGAGPAGLTAALFAARAGRRTVMLTPTGAGGAILNCERVEDLPGFPQGVAGFDYGPMVADQAMDAGCTMEFASATGLTEQAGVWTVGTDGPALQTRCVVVATGSSPLPLGIAREDEFEGRGISNCASCDGRFFEGKTVAVAGGGDSALVEALELAGYGVRVVVVTRSHELTAQHTYRQRVLDHEAIEVIPGSVVDEICGESEITGLVLRDIETGDRRDLDVSGIFVHVGRRRNTALLEGTVPLLDDGSVPTDLWMRTARPGLLAAGDIRADSASQAVTAAGDGATAALAADAYLAAGLDAWPEAATIMHPRNAGG